MTNQEGTHRQGWEVAPCVGQTQVRIPPLHSPAGWPRASVCHVSVPPFPHLSSAFRTAAALQRVGGLREIEDGSSQLGVRTQPEPHRCYLLCCPYGSGRPGPEPGASRCGGRVPQSPHLHNGDSDRNYGAGVDAASGHPWHWAWLCPHAPIL